MSPCLNNQFIDFFLIKHFTKYTSELVMFYFSDHVWLQSGKDTTAIVARLSCCGLSLTSDDFKLLCHSCLCIICSKSFLKKCQFSITFWEKGGQELDTLPFSKSTIIQDFLLLFAFYFISFTLKYFKCLT